MRLTPPDRSAHQRGVTLIEMIVAMVIVAIVAAITIFFASPLQQAVDTTTRAELTDIAENSLQRIGRDLRLALPNSLRVTGTAIEFIPVRTAGRYRVESNGACGGNDNRLQFGVADGCFSSIGPISGAATVAVGDALVLSNYGEGFTDQDAYDGGNRRDISAPIAGQTVTYTAGAAFNRALHDSPGRRFFIVTTPVAYVCDLTAGTITRYTGYGWGRPPTLTNGTGALLASNISDCSFEYEPNVAPLVGLVTLRLTLSKAVATGTERVRLYHAVHVNNVP